MSLDTHPRASAGPRSARREATRNRILDAAAMAFAEKGVFGATIEDICERAGFTRGAVYSNFTDKDDILRAVIEREQAALLKHLSASFEQLGEEVAAAPDVEHGVETVVTRILHSLPIDRQVSLIQAELEIHAVRRPDQAETWVAVNAEFRSRLVAAMSEALRRIGREPAVDPDDLLDAVLAIGERSVRRALIDGAEGPDRLSAAVLPSVLLALSRPLP